MSQSSLNDQDVLAMAIFADSQDTGGGNNDQRQRRQEFYNESVIKRSGIIKYCGGHDYQSNERCSKGHIHAEFN